METLLALLTITVVRIVLPVTIILSIGEWVKKYEKRHPYQPSW